MERVELDGLTAVHHEIEVVTALYFHPVLIYQRLAVLRRPFAEQAGATGHNAGANAVTLVTRMIQFTGDAHHAIARRTPAANGGVVLVVPHMSAVGIEDDPAQFRVRQVRAALPGVPGPMREWCELLHLP